MITKDIKVLIVEDEKVLADVYSTKLGQLEYDYRQTNDGEAGIKEAIKFIPDIILLDIILPKKDGFTVLRELKANSKTKNIPVILLTNLGQSDDVEKGLSLGAVDYMIKSDYTPTQITDKIESILKLSKK